MSHHQDTQVLVLGHTLRKMALAVAAIMISGCSFLSDKLKEASTWSDEKLYEHAQQALSEHDWGLCAKYFGMLEGRAALDRYAQQAQLNAAYCNWKDKQNTAALQFIERFIRQYPAHQRLDYAFYLKGLINSNDELSLLGRLSHQDISERDPYTARDAYQAFKAVVKYYPSSPYAMDAAQRMRYIVNMLAAHEVHVADYYYRRGAYIAAANRAQAALEQFENAPAAEEALRLLILSYQALGESQLAHDAERVLQATFPASPYLKR
nr:outer membrane protein assembly factor BamD [Candidatus Glomeribacter gigasporarum]